MNCIEELNFKKITLDNVINIFKDIVHDYEKIAQGKLMDICVDVIKQLIHDRIEIENCQYRIYTNFCDKNKTDNIYKSEVLVDISVQIKVEGKFTTLLTSEVEAYANHACRLRNVSSILRHFDSEFRVVFVC